MSFTAAWALQVGLRAHLAIQNEVTDLLGLPPRLYDHVPDDTIFPFLTLGESRIRPIEGDDRAMEHDVRLNAWSRWGGRREVRELTEIIHSVLHGHTFDVESHDLISCRFILLIFSRAQRVNLSERHEVPYSDDTYRRFAMSLLTGRNVLLKIRNEADSFDVIGGLRTKTFSLVKGVEDITLANGNGWRELLPCGAIRSAEISGQGIFLNDEASEAVRRNVTSDQHAYWQMKMIGVGIFEGYFHIARLDYTGGFKDEAEFVIRLQSSGEVIFTGESV